MKFRRATHPVVGFEHEADAPCSGKSMGDTYLLPMRCPVFRRRDSHLAFRMELETLAGHVKGKSSSGGPARLKVTDGPTRRGLPYSSDEAG